MALYTYSARGLKLQVTNTLFDGGVGLDFAVSGYAPDEFLTIETEDDDWTTEEGADGFVVRSMIPNGIQKMVLTLQQTSPTNDKFTRLWLAGKGFDTGNVVGTDIFAFNVTPPLAPKVGGKNTLFSSQNCYISKIAPMSYAKEAGTRSWEITSVGGVFGADTLSSILQGAGNLVRDIGSFTQSEIPL